MNPQQSFRDPDGNLILPNAEQSEAAKQSLCPCGNPRNPCLMFCNQCLADAAKTISEHPSSDDHQTHLTAHNTYCPYCHGPCKRNTASGCHGPDGEPGINPKPIKLWTDEQYRWLLGAMELTTKLQDADNRKILWLAMNTSAWKSADVVGVEADILAEVENRLYPEYDGDTVSYTEWGWQTPDGEIRYLPQ